MEGPARDRHRRHRRLPRPGRRQGRTPRHRRHTSREEAFRQAPAQHRTQAPRAVRETLQAKHGTVLVVVDQPASIGALPRGGARDMGCPVAYLPGLTMRRIADLYPGEAKTDARDAYIIADAASRDAPHTAGDRRQGRDHRRAGDDRGLRRRPGRRGDQGRQPAARPADPDPPVAGTGAEAAVAAPGRPHAARRVRISGPDPQGRPSAAGHPAAAEGAEDGRATGRRDLHRVGRADRNRSRDPGGRADRPEPGRLIDDRA
jgi:hypothetical protein